MKNPVLHFGDNINGRVLIVVIQPKWLSGFMHKLPLEASVPPNVCKGCLLLSGGMLKATVEPY